jgi:hypothetical protein
MLEHIFMIFHGLTVFVQDDLDGLLKLTKSNYVFFIYQDVCVYYIYICTIALSFTGTISNCSAWDRDFVRSPPGLPCCPSWRSPLGCPEFDQIL